MSEILQTIMISLLQVVLALGLVNVWVMRFHKPTQYRAKGSANMEQEFHAYGLPTWFMYVVGGLKLSIAVALVAGLWFPFLVCPSVGLLGLLMIGAIAMHIKVRDSLVRTLPAIGMLLMVLIIVVLVRFI
jgi:uncharacterized membrane protein YphA (DoxX/SURF4 family)